jgi:hypothetical protein
MDTAKSAATNLIQAGTLTIANRTPNMAQQT